MLSSTRRTRARDTRAETLASNFVYHWLDLKRLEEVEPDTSIFPYASGRGDFPDYLIAERSMASGCSAVVTFDRALHADTRFSRPE